MTKGLAGVPTPSARELAKKWNLPLVDIAKKIAAGSKVEKEHTTSTKQAAEIARDHINERPDYYEKVKKMEKSPIVKEEIGTGGIRGLGFVTGDPGISYVDQYINTNAMSYEDWNGNILKLIKDRHNKHLKDMGFSSYSPNEIQSASNKVMKEQTLNELGEYDNKGGSPGYEGLTDPQPRVYRKNEMAENDLKGACWKGYTAKGLKKKGGKMVPNCVPVKEQSPANVSYKERPMYERSTGKVPADMSGGADRGIYQEGHIGFGHPYDWAGDRVKRKVYGTKPKEKPESNEPGTENTYKGSKQSGKVKFAKTVKESQIDEISAELVGKVSNARFWQKKTPSKTLTRAINKKFVESGKKKEEPKKEVKEYWTPFITPHHKHSARLSKEKANKPDTIMDPGAAGTTHTVKEETKMDNRELINEALDCILENNLPEMKDNLMKALQEKAMEKLEERKKEIAANYFAE